jgi:hypothetical protein
MHVREIKQVYTVGQIEPKQEVYAPQSRNHGTFLKKKVQAFALKYLKERGYNVPFSELRKIFIVFNDQV